MKENTTPLLNNDYLAYVRVSSKDQARGTSLDEQKAYIERYCQAKKLSVKQYYGESESASKTGRQIFDEMILRLQEEKLRGIIFHKVDRSARNPKDQALLYELTQQGYELHFAAEGISTQDPMGKNMMYMMWGMASGYSENLRMEINKGIGGRLKQGKWPGPVAVGYKRGADPKECETLIDETKAPLVKYVFNEYASGKYTVEQMVKFARSIGLTNKNSRPLSKNSVHDMLRNTFYYGLITCKRGTFPGAYEPIISKALFDKVQFVLQDRGFRIVNKYNYTFQGLLRCGVCGKKLKAMTIKERFTYYLCKNSLCGIKTISEECLEKQLLKEFKQIEFNDEELEGFKKAVLAFRGNAVATRQEQISAIELELKNIDARLEGMLQKFIEQKIDDETYSKARKALLNRQVDLRETRDKLEKIEDKTFGELDELSKMLVRPTLAYKKADWLNRRRIILSMVGKLEVMNKKLCVHWRKHFEMIANRPKLEFGAFTERS